MLELLIPIFIMATPRGDTRTERQDLFYSWSFLLPDMICHSRIYNICTQNCAILYNRYKPFPYRLQKY